MPISLHSQGLYESYSKTDWHDGKDGSARDNDGHDSQSSRPRLELHIPPTQIYGRPERLIAQPVLISNSKKQTALGLENDQLTLEIQGGLQFLCKDWTEKEVKAKRRLVEFQLHRKGSTIIATAQSVYDADNPAAAYISCIWWEQRNGHYVTSVDTIRLLAALVKTKFTVKEKNRIRRKLHRFKPITASRLKDDSKAFFRLIMDFPHPKPRNIQKDIKVLQWSVLEEALKWVTRKYVSSFSLFIAAIDIDKPKWQCGKT
jgi:hypothetical protein